MSRLPGLGAVGSLAALIFLAALVAVAAWALGPLAGGPGGVSPSPTALAEQPTPTVSPTASPTSEPSGDVVAYTNPEGISPDGFAGDDYPFIEQARSLPTFAGVWMDPNQRDFHVAVTRDIAGAIEALRDGIPRGITVYFHIAQFPYAELREVVDAMFADRDALMAKGILLTSGGVSEMEGRIFIGMSPTSPEAIAYMQGRYPGPVTFEKSGAWALRRVNPPEGLEVRLIAVRQGEDLGLLTCGHRPFAESALDSPPVDIAASGPEFIALREDLEINFDLYGDLSSLPWILAERDDYGATFLVRLGDRLMEAPLLAGTSGWAPGTIDDCSPRALGSDDYGVAEWGLDPDFAAPTAASTEVHVIVTEWACASGSSPAGRLVPPTVRYSARELLIEVGVRYLGGEANCPTNPSQPVTIVLPEPVGDRILEGGSPAVP